MIAPACLAAVKIATSSASRRSRSRTGIASSANRMRGRGAMAGERWASSHRITQQRPDDPVVGRQSASTHRCRRAQDLAAPPAPGPRVKPEASRSSTSVTRMRILRTQGRPPHCRGFTVIRSTRFISTLRRLRWLLHWNIRVRRNWAQGYYKKDDGPRCGFRQWKTVTIAAQDRVFPLYQTGAKEAHLGFSPHGNWRLLPSTTGPMNGPPRDGSRPRGRTARLPGSSLLSHEVGISECGLLPLYRRLPIEDQPTPTRSVA